MRSKQAKGPARRVARATKPLQWLFWAVSVGALTGACSDELGDCDARAANQLVYSPSGLVATKGQALIHDSCGAGAFCHSQAATGKNRYGAPAALDFDMCPRPAGWTRLVEHGADVWRTIAREQMPPRGRAGRKTVSSGQWSFDPDLGAGAVMLPPIDSKEGKGIVRNWLACGAPVVGDAVLPGWARPPASFDAGADVAWSALFSQIIAPKCATAGCHDDPAAGGLVLTDACGAYRQLLAVGMCGGEPRVVPADGNSLLLDKLESEAPRCGARMPTSGPLPASEQMAIRQWVEAGALAPDCE